MPRASWSGVRATAFPRSATLWKAGPRTSCATTRRRSKPPGAPAPGTSRRISSKDFRSQAVLRRTAALLVVHHPLGAGRLDDRIGVRIHRRDFGVAAIGGPGAGGGGEELGLHVAADLGGERVQAMVCLRE